MIIFSGNACSGKSSKMCKFINDNADKSFCILNLENTMEFYCERIDNNCEVSIINKSREWSDNESVNIIDIIKDYKNTIKEYNLKFDFVVIDFISSCNAPNLIKYIKNEIEAEPILLIQEPYKNNVSNKSVDIIKFR